ncbi:DUF3857 domain-containing transglutaminase family protein [Paraglaciecola sp. 2405UD69-4]|uniref:DUF3857 domain-containing transglutaminase family protein n=1 Tax=Paraglaciecola sp. 2405UD69-4 TaxID=3391836 RepID=UPI0039C999BB
MPIIQKLKPLLWGLIALSIVQFSHGATEANTDLAKVTKAAPASWVRLQSYQVGELASLNSPTHYHLVDNQVSGVDKKQSYSRYVYSLTDISGVESNSDIRIRFNPAYETVVIHDIGVHRRGKLVNSFDIQDIEVINAEDSQNKNIYSGLVDALLLLKDTRVGDVIDYSYTVVGSNPVFGNRITYGSYLGWSVPVDKVNLMANMPKDRPLNYKVFNAKEEVKTQVTSELLSYSLTINKTPALYEEDNMPSSYDPYPFVQFSEYKDWSDVAAWANELFSSNYTPSKELADFIVELKAMSQDKAISAAINFTQDQIRYLGLELGENSHRPHRPSDTFENRSGDCKDKSYLLAFLLGQLGIQAHPALVSTSLKGSLNDYLPSHSFFDHAIVEFTVAGEQYWIDPTITHQGKSYQSKYQTNYELALLVSDTTTQLLDATPSRSKQSHIELKELIVSADYMSPVQWTIRSTFTFKEAENLRYRIKSQGKDYLSKQYLNFYAKQFPNIEVLTPLTIDDNTSTNVVTITEQYLVPDFWFLNAQKSAEFSIRANYSGQYVEKPSSIKREHPLAIAENISIDHDVIFQLPEHIDFTSETEHLVLEDQYIKFISDISYDRRRFRFRNQYLTKQNRVHVENVSEHIALLDKIQNRMSYSNSITNVTEELGRQELNRLIHSLNTKTLSQSATTGN